jgi:hypothetical protein
MPDRVVVEVVAIEQLPVAANGSRRAVVRWSDGSRGEALRWFDDLCGHPHKSSYAERRVMPTTQRNDWRVAAKDSAGSA